MKELISRFDKMHARRSTWATNAQEVAEYVRPYRNDIVTTRAMGEKRIILLDSTAIFANRLLASFLHNSLTSPYAQWFELSHHDPDVDALPAVREFLEDAGKKMFRVFSSPSSGFTSANEEVFLDLGCFGMGSLFVNESAPGSNQILFRTHHVREIYVEEDSAGRVDTVFRLFKPTARQVAQRWPDVEIIEKTLKQNPEQEFEVIHAVYPRKDRDITKLGSKNMPYASVYILKEHEVVLSEGGFEENPFMVPRWDRVPGDPYGYGPGWHALPEAKMINVMMETHVKTAQKTLDPPLLLQSETSVFPIDTRPGGINFGGVDRNGNQMIRTLDNNNRADLAMALIDRKLESVREIFFTPQILTAGSPVKTATQVMQEVEERMQSMGPVIGRLQTEYLGPLVDRVFNIMLRSGAFGEIPAELSGQDIKVEYISPIVRAQKANEIMSINRAFNVLAPIASLDPSVLDVFDTEKMPRHVTQLAGVSEKVLRNSEEVAELREQREQEMLAQSALNQVQQGSQALVNASQSEMALANAEATRENSG